MSSGDTKAVSSEFFLQNFLFFFCVGVESEIFFILCVRKVKGAINHTPVSTFGLVVPRICNLSALRAMFRYAKTF